MSAVGGLGVVRVCSLFLLAIFLLEYSAHPLWEQYWLSLRGCKENNTRNPRCSPSLLLQVSRALIESLILQPVLKAGIFQSCTTIPSSRRRIMHNNKQNKVPLRKEGIDFEKIATGDAGQEDTLMWVQGDTYVPFEPQHLSSLGDGKARL